MNVLAYLGIQSGSVSEGTTVEVTVVPDRAEDSDEEISMLYASIVTLTEKGTSRGLLIAKPIPDAGRRKNGHRMLANSDHESSEKPWSDMNPKKKKNPLISTPEKASSLLMSMCGSRDLTGVGNGSRRQRKIESD